ncbi:MAG: CRISPR-associated protein Cas4 [bacterium]|nr:CRISPR-associated protein Cas4 [bacterium]
MTTYPDLPMNEDDMLEVAPETSVEDAVPISLLKQYIYCPRVVYYETCTPKVRPTTYKMEAGNDAHDRERSRAARRTLFAYHAAGGERHFDVRILSAKLSLSGLVDEVVIAPEEAIVVDYKMADWAGDNHLIQLAAYALLVEEAFRLPVRRGFIYLMKARQFEEVAIDEALRNSVLETLQNIQRIRYYEYMPPPVEAKNKCLSCEFRRFCNDV